MTIRIRLIKQRDLTAIAALQDRCYSAALYESPALLQQRLQVASDCCWLAETATGQLLAYLFSYPSVDAELSALAAPFSRHSAATLLYLHDLAVSPAARGLQLSNRLLQCAKQFALHQGYNKLALIAVQNSRAFWQRQGFIEITALPAVALQALASYQPERAHYMQLIL